MTRRTLIASIGAAAAVSAAPTTPHKEWRPKLGVLGRYTPGNVAFAQSAGFTNMILDAGSIRHADPDEVKRTLQAHSINVSAIQITVNHIDPDPAKRTQINDWVVDTIKFAGRVGIPYLGSASGKDASQPFEKQVDEVVRVYNEKYFKACEENHVRILWEPWPEGPNLAVSPVGFSALLKAFNDSPYVGLQYDPSHLVRQFMDPIETAREFSDYIYDVHLKDTEILPDKLRSGGINPINGQKWWRYRIPGMGSISWREFFNVLQAKGYTGAMSIEQEDPLYGADTNTGPEFTEDFKMGFIMAKRYLNQYVP